MAKTKAEGHGDGTIIHAAVWPALLRALRTDDLSLFRQRLNDVMLERERAGTITRRGFVDEIQAEFEVMAAELLARRRADSVELTALWHALSRLLAEAVFSFSESYLKAAKRKSPKAISRHKEMRNIFPALIDPNYRW